MAHIQMIDRRDADGELAAVYDAMAARPLPPAYRPPHGGAPGIIRAHSLDPRLVRLVFGTTGSLHAGSLAWGERELVSAVAARTAGCFY